MQLDQLDRVYNNLKINLTNNAYTINYRTNCMNSIWPHTSISSLMLKPLRNIKIYLASLSENIDQLSFCNKISPFCT